MKTLITVFALFVTTLVSAQGPAFDFDKEVLRFDKTPEGELLSFNYHFKNTGDAPLIIQDIKVACTCTKAEFPRQPVPPGGEGDIKVTFNTKGKIGYQDRTLDILSNAPGKPVSLRFKVVVDNKVQGK